MMQPRAKLNLLVAEISRRNYQVAVYAKAHA
jgi:hypothetical protein